MNELLDLFVLIDLLLLLLFLFVYDRLSVHDYYLRLVFVFLNQTKSKKRKRTENVLFADSQITLITVSRKTSSLVRRGRICRGSSTFTLH